MTTLYRMGFNPWVRVLLLVGMLIGMTVLSGCADANTAIDNAAQSTMDGVVSISAFVAIAIMFYWISFAILFGLRGFWQEGFSVVQSTWKMAAFITVLAIIGIPAGLGWAQGIVDSGGFQSGG